MGESLSRKATEQLLRAKVLPGSIVHCYCDFLHEPKNKFIVIVHIDEDYCAFFLINSRIHPLIEKNPNLKACQILFSQSEYSFLDHDSYLNCLEYFDCITFTHFIGHLVSNPNDYKGRVKVEELQDIIEAVHFTPTLSLEEKNMIIQSLECII